MPTAGCSRSPPRSRKLSRQRRRSPDGTPRQRRAIRVPPPPDCIQNFVLDFIRATWTLDTAMDFTLTPEQQQIRNSILKLCSRFDDNYWREIDRAGKFPHELHEALAQAGWLGIAMPTEHGGSGLGITEAAI